MIIYLFLGSKGVQRYRNRKQFSSTSSESRFSTQPVTFDEVQEAVRANIRLEKSTEDLTSGIKKPEIRSFVEILFYYVYEYLF